MKIQQSESSFRGPVELSILGNTLSNKLESEDMVLILPTTGSIFLLKVEGLGVNLPFGVPALMLLFKGNIVGNLSCCVSVLVSEEFNISFKCLGTFSFLICLEGKGEWIVNDVEVILNEILS